jgi:hypothetical protein
MKHPMHRGWPALAFVTVMVSVGLGGGFAAAAPAPPSFYTDEFIIGTDCSQGLHVTTNWSAPIAGQDHIDYFIVDRRTGQAQSASVSVGSGDTTSFSSFDVLGTLERGKHRIRLTATLKNASNGVLAGPHTVTVGFPCVVLSP